ncbi:MAG: beta-Ala-His dipeptidase [Bacteroidaceae bacterium]|nr:beta-Ala-His dipeptidase [Bacteroidaceae bacterium]
MNEIERKPATVFECFAQVNQIPRPSKREEKMIAFLREFGERLGLPTKVDDAGNVLISKPASPGMEGRAAVVLQSHMDMVCEKNADVEFDFDKDAIQTYVDGEWMKAKGTTLGADDGIGVAMQMAVLQSDDIKHGPLECLFTRDEETGLTGAEGLSPDFVKGRTLVNLDSEDEGEIFVSCAGGCRTFAQLPYTLVDLPGGMFVFSLTIKGLTGGHSGDDIEKKRANANKLLARFLYVSQRKYDLWLVDMQAGGLHNAIPREARCVCAVPMRDKESVRVDWNLFAHDVEVEYSVTERGMEFLMESEDVVRQAIDQDVSRRLITALQAVDNGVFAFCQDIELVETSSNLASIHVCPQTMTIDVNSSQRSSIYSARVNMANTFAADLVLREYYGLTLTETCMNGLGGLLYYSYEDGVFRSLSADGTVPGQCVYAMTRAADGNVWASVDGDIYRLERKGEDLACTRVGLDFQLKHFNYLSACADSQGRLWFGSTDGLLCLTPQSLATQVVYPLISLESLTDSENQFLPMNECRRIRLTHAEAKVIGVEYAAICPAGRGDIVYQVLMEGLSQDWQYVGNQQRIYYTHLSPGEYVFKVRASSDPSSWSDDNIYSVVIVVDSPWYATLPAYVMYVVVLLGLGALLRVFYKRRMRERQSAFENFLEKRKLENLNHMKRDFMTRLAHEFKTPLTLITAPAQRILEGGGKLPDRMSEHLHTILKGANTMQMLLQELMELNTKDSFQHDITWVTGNPLKLITDILKGFQPLSAQRDIKLLSEIEDWDEDVEFSPVAVERILNNLLSNAFKFTPEGGTVSVDALLIREKPVAEGNNSSCRRLLQIQVSDTGIGISPEDQKKIFGQFYQAHHNPDLYGGWGVGLSVVNEMVNQHRGTIDVQSNPGKGSCFCVTLDVTLGTHDGVRKDNPSTAKQCQGNAILPSQYFEMPEDVSDVAVTDNRPTILVVEDNQDMCRFIQSLFDEEFNVSCAVNGTEAFQKMQKGRLPDVIISDVMMPSMSGTDLCKLVKGDLLTAHIPFILLTAKGGMENAQKGYEMGADLFVEKPFNPSLLQMQVRNILRTRDNNRRDFKDSPTMNISIMAENKYDKKLLSDIYECVERNIGNSDFCVDDIVTEVGVSRTKLHVKLKSLINMSIGEYIKERRIKKAEKLLRQGESITDVAYATGFSDPNYFSKCFKKKTGLSPKEYFSSKGKTDVKPTEIS